VQRASGVGPEEEVLEERRSSWKDFPGKKQGRLQLYLVAQQGEWGRRGLAAPPRAREAQCFAQARGALTRLLPIRYRIGL
jgi:hypothetical protein